MNYLSNLSLTPHQCYTVSAGRKLKVLNTRHQALAFKAFEEIEVFLNVLDLK